MMWKKLLPVGYVATGHLALTQLISTAILQLTPSAIQADLAPATVRLLVPAAKVLHFPVISLVLYPRGLFPGNWILLPMMVNSLVWGSVLYAAWRIVVFALAGKSSSQ